MLSISNQLFYRVYYWVVQKARRTKGLLIWNALATLCGSLKSVLVVARSSSRAMSKIRPLLGTMKQNFFGEEADSFLTMIQPILLSLNIFGIDVNWRGERSSIRRNLVRISQIIWSLILLVSICLALHNLIHIIENPENESTVLLCFKITGYVTDQALSTFIFLAQTFAARKYGPQLIQQFLQIKTRIPVIKKVRLVAIIGILLSIVMVKQSLLLFVLFYMYIDCYMFICR